MSASRKKIFLFLVFIIAMGAVMATANAKIDLLTASFETNWVDLDVSGVKLERTYSSRSIHNGLFGYGWCSPLESVVEFSLPPSTNTALTLNECDHKLEFKFDSNLDVWLGPGSSRMTREQDHLILSANGKPLKTFDGTSGRLLEWVQPSGRKLVLSYDRRGLLQDAATGEGLRLRIMMDPSLRKIRSIQIAGDKVERNLEFEYQDLNLIKAKNAWSNTYYFSYDSLHNLTQIDFPDHTSEQLLYDTDRDQVLLFKGRNGCKENYSYTSAPSRMIAEATKTCSGQPSDHLKLDIDINTVTFTRNGVKQIQSVQINTKQP
jgi:YD repeat-containing protein